MAGSFHGYYGDWCFAGRLRARPSGKGSAFGCLAPLGSAALFFCGEQLLVSSLRPSNIDPAKHAWAILKLLVTRLRQTWPGVKIILRDDSGFCRWKMLRWCERHGVDYLVGLAKNSRLLALAAESMQSAAAQFASTQEKQRHFGWIDYAARYSATCAHAAVGPLTPLAHLWASDGSHARFPIESRFG